TLPFRRTKRFERKLFFSQDGEPLRQCDFFRLVFLGKLLPDFALFCLPLETFLCAFTRMRMLLCLTFRSQGFLLLFTQLALQLLDVCFERRCRVFGRGRWDEGACFELRLLGVDAMEPDA